MWIMSRASTRSAPSYPQSLPASEGYDKGVVTLVVEPKFNNSS